METTVKRFPPPQVAEGSWDYYDEIEQLCDLRYGRGYMTRALYSHWMEHPEMIQIALVDGRFAGCTGMYPVTPEEVVRKLAVVPADVARIAGGRPILYYNTTVVRQEYDGRGYSQAMIRSAVQIARDQGFGSIFGSAWIYDNATPIARTVKRMGFQPLYRRKMLWYDDKNYTCIICKGPCRCDAEIYYKKLWEDEA